MLFHVIVESGLRGVEKGPQRRACQWHPDMLERLKGRVGRAPAPNGLCKSLLEIRGRAEDFTMRVQNALGELTSQGFELAKEASSPPFLGGVS